MRVGVLGVNYKTADLELREKIARIFQEWIPEECGEYVILSTCNRTEVYFSGDDLTYIHSSLLAFLKGHFSFSFEHVLYSYFGKDCFSHLISVTAGLDSAVLGESEIQRQVKVAYSKAAQDSSLSQSMHFLFQKSLQVGKELRQILPCPMSLPSIVLQLVDLFFPRSPFKVFLLGFSEINRKIARQFYNKKIPMTLCTRSVNSAEEFALDHGISLVDWSQMHLWSQFDVVICGTHHDQYLLSDRPDFSKTRLILDLSVPRSVDPEMKKSPFLTVLNMEEIGNLMEKDREKHASELARARVCIEQRAERQISIFYAKTQRARESVGRGSHPEYFPSP